MLTPALLPLRVPLDGGPPVDLAVPPDEERRILEPRNAKVLCDTVLAWLADHLGGTAGAGASVAAPRTTRPLSLPPSLL